MRIEGRRGYTVLELLIVMAILVTLLSLAGAAMAAYRERTRLSTTVEAVASDIREARWKSRMSGEMCSVAFDTASQSYTVNGVRTSFLPAGIRFGSDPSVTSRPSQPYEAPPDDGISFDLGKKNVARFFPTGIVSPTGALFITNGKKTYAITVAITGRPKIWRSCGGRNWVAD